MASPKNLEAFDPFKLADSFASCLVGIQDGDQHVHLGKYLDGFDELEKFLRSLGPLFYLVAREVHEKKAHLRALQASDGLNEALETVNTLITHEIEAGVIRLGKNSPSSGNGGGGGARNLLRLHRGMAFLVRFLEMLLDLPMESGSSEAARLSYEDTLAHYHPKTTRCFIGTGIRLLPAKKDLLARAFCDTKESQQYSLNREAALRTALPIMSRTYDTVQSIFAKHDALDLP